MAVPGTDGAGGLVGIILHQGTNSITASYATGDANGDAGLTMSGALVGQNFLPGTQTITHSYAFGSGNGGRYPWK